MLTGNGTHPQLTEDLDYILGHVAEFAEDLRGARLFITGGTGFFGKWLLESFTGMVDHLDLEGASAVVLTRDPDAFRRRMPALAAHPSLHFVAGDVRTFPFPAGSFDYVVHAATDASTTLNVEQPLLMLDTIVEGTRRVLDLVRHSGARRFLFTSSGAAYGPQPPDLTHLPETFRGANDTMAPGSAYGEGKRLAEVMCADYARLYDFDSVIARCWAFLGPYLPLDGSFAAGNFVRDAVHREKIQIGGDGTPYRSYLYAADLAIWLWTLLLRGQSCRIYNVGSGNAVTIRELANRIAACPELTSVPQIDIARAPVLGAPAQRYVPDVTRAADELNLREGIGLEDGIARTIRWIRKLPNE